MCQPSLKKSLHATLYGSLSRAVEPKDAEPAFIQRNRFHLNLPWINGWAKKFILRLLWFL
jgi:hypothetical protein